MKSIFIILCFVCSTALACQPLLRIFETRGEAEDDIVVERFIIEDEPDLALKNITNSHTYTCPEGVWMGYRNEHFGGAEGEIFILSGVRDGIFHCRHEGEGRDQRVIRSVKPIGSREDYTASAVATYPRVNNAGPEDTYLENAGKTNNTFQSLILVGHQSIEIFTDEEHRGESFCVRPSNGDISNEQEFSERNGWDGTEMYTNLRDLQAIFGRADFKSFKFDCDFRK